MDRFPFLSDGWVAEARRIREQYGRLDDGVPGDVRMNQVITDVPFGEGRIHSHIDTSTGCLDMDLGHLEKVDVTVTLDYETAKAVFVDGTPSAAMAAFLAGKVRVQGELGKLLLALQQLNPPDESAVSEVQDRIRSITL